MKPAHIRIEVSKGDPSQDKPWVMLIRTVQRDRVQTVLALSATGPQQLRKQFAETVATK